ncbi:MAG: hypothetical protein FGM27_04140 [Candidatus Omnitrophica bacterium]|nr:hypothetical protein [Candidatus Omnitrophota bacterium]
MDNAWEDLVDDFLDVACRLGPAQRKTVLETLKQEGLSSPYLEVHPAFSIEGRLVVILGSKTVQKLAVFLPEEGSVQSIESCGGVFYGCSNSARQVLEKENA